MRTTIPVLVLALTVGCAARQAPQTAAVRPASPPPSVRNAHELLQDVLWVQTSAEYRVLAQSAYDRAAAVFDRALNDASWTAAVEQDPAHTAGLPVAVVMDLDETVLDNSRVEGQFILDGTPYVTPTWSEWVGRAAAGEVPGAKAFIEHVRGKGGRVIFITNRTAAEQADTVRNLADVLHIPATADDVLCVGENGWTSDKSARRRIVAEKYRIALLVGDDLGDFVSLAGTATAADRTTLAAKYQDQWRDRWVLLPNPMYGSWERILTPGLTSDADVLEKKRATVKGFRGQ